MIKIAARERVAALQRARAEEMTARARDGYKSMREYETSDMI